MKTYFLVMIALGSSFILKSQNINNQKKNVLTKNQVELLVNTEKRDSLNKAQHSNNPIGKDDKTTTNIIQRTEKRIMVVNPKKTN